MASKGYEAKGPETGPHFYLSHGVKDVVFDPTTLLVLHVRRDGTTRRPPPVAVDLECGLLLQPPHATTPRPLAEREVAALNRLRERCGSG